MTKRLFDVFFALFGLIVLSPAFLLISLWIRADSPGAVFYRQTRVGLNGAHFKIRKFRTMYADSDDDGKLTIGDDRRITASGRVLRKYKIDELPQLVNVVSGDMSLVGPRPEVQEFIDCCPDDIKNKILSVRPGITDMASLEMFDENDVLARYDNPEQAYIDTILPVKWRHYVHYVENRTILFDIGIIISTVKRIFIR